MGMSGLPDMYTRSPRAAGPRAEGVHIRQTTNAHGITVMCHMVGMGDTSTKISIPILKVLDT